MSPHAELILFIFPLLKKVLETNIFYFLFEIHQVSFMSTVSKVVSGIHWFYLLTLSFFPIKFLSLILSTFVTIGNYR